MDTALSLPGSLTRQFDLLERRLWRMDALVAVTGGAGALLLSYALQFVSDRIWDTPEWLRMCFAICGWAGFLTFAWRYGNRWIWRRRSIRTLAMIVQRRYRRLGDRLLGIVELADPAARPSNYSAELCHAAIDQVAREASGFDFQEAAGERQPRQYIVAFLALAVLVAGVACLAPEAGWNALERWFFPAAHVERYTFVTIESLPDHLVVAQGEPFEIAVGLARGSFWKPERAESWFAGQAATGASIRHGMANFHLPGQTESRVMWLQIGDVRRSIRIQPEVRPDLKQVRVRLDLPAYLHYPRQEQTVEGGAISFLPGTTAMFTGEAVRNLASAMLVGEKPVPLSVSGPLFHTPAMLLELERDITCRWRDTLGLDGPAPLTIHVTPKEDEPPTVGIRGLEAAIAVLPEETVPIALAATDDYGVRRLSLIWQKAAGSPQDLPGPEHERSVAEGRPQERALSGHYEFNAALLRVPEETTILVRGLAVDYYPDRQPSSTPIYRIHVLSREEHARLIHDEFEKLLERLEEVTRRQEVVMQNGKAVRSQNAQKLAADESAQKLGTQSSEQRETAEQMKELTKQFAANLAEAMRNPEISPETLKAWASHAEAMQQMATSSMPEAAHSLDSAKTDATQRAGKLDQALAQEQKILDQMRKMEQQANQDLESLMAQTLAARLRKAAASERGIASSFQQMLPDTIGMTAAQLPDAQKRTLADMTTAHTDVTREADRLQAEISRLYDRTTLARYGDVAREMDALKTEDALVALGKQVEKNVGVQSMTTARYWGDQFDRWAGRLSQQDQSQSKPPSGKGKPNPAELQALMALMRLRQQQDQVREQTNALEEQKQTSDDYANGAHDAGTIQSALQQQVASLEADPKFPIPPSQMKPIGQSMGEAAGLLAKPETGKPTYNAQTDAMNLLDAAISQQAQKSGQSGSSLMQMMGMGGTGNGSTNGGTTNQPNVQLAGSRAGEAPEQRQVMQAGGIDYSPLPGEFRDAIEGYHRAIERSQP